MKKMFILCLLVVIMSGCAEESNNVMSQGSTVKEYYPLNVGDWWEYHVIHKESGSGMVSINEEYDYRKVIVDEYEENEEIVYVVKVINGDIIKYIYYKYLYDAVYVRNNMEEAWERVYEINKNNIDNENGSTWVKITEDKIKHVEDEHCPHGGCTIVLERGVGMLSKEAYYAYQGECSSYRCNISDYGVAKGGE